MTSIARRTARAAAGLVVAIAAGLSGAAPGAADSRATGVFFDDFSYPRLEELRAFGWTLRDRAGHPGVPGARWSPEALSLRAEGRDRVLQLAAHTDGSAEGTVQSQLCHARKVLRGTYAARVRFANAPVQGAGGDPVIQTFYAVAPLRHDFDPEFSEIDWEYLAQGGWGSPATRLYAITWQTVRIEPWLAHNQAHEEKRTLAGWVTLVTQVRDDGTTRWFVDGREIARHGGRNHPVVPMAISFSLWFSPGGLLPKSAEPRVWTQSVDWVYHAAGRTLAPREVEAEVQRLRRRGVERLDTVPAATPPLASPCNL